MIVGFDMYPQLIFKTGVRVVIANLLKALRTRYPEHAFVELLPSARPFADLKDSWARKSFNHAHRVAWTQWGLPRAAQRHGCDVLFATAMFAPYLRQLPTVALIHDLAVWRHPEWYPRFWRGMNELFTRAPARRADHVVTVSEDARRDAITIFGLHEDKVTAIHPGLELLPATNESDADVLRRYEIPNGARYVLHMGPMIPHKNLAALVEAFRRMLTRLPDQPLYLVLGGPPRNTHGKDAVREIRFAAAPIKDRVRFPGFVPREHCAVLYRNAMVYAVPSLFEGFGLPVIEAMSCGTPVVASDRASLPEVGGDAALYFDPLCVEDLTDVLLRVATRPEVRARMVARGLARARQFTWEEAADRYIKVFERVSGPLP
jgi:glycosyltransferase involved in cell wall biosynthesis